MRVLRAVSLSTGVAAIGLLPLYGDPKPSGVVSHAEWARMVLRGLGLLAEAPGLNDTAQQVFSTLVGRDSRAFPADRYVRATRLEITDQDGARGVRPRGGIGQAVYAMSVARAGDYRLRLHLAGPSAAEAELTKAGDEAVLRRFSVPAQSTLGWADAGTVHLDAGAYDTTVLLPEGSTLDYLEIAPPCVHPIEPRGGWKTLGVTTTEDVAITVLQALDLESELPPSGSALEFHGGDLRLDDGSPVPASDGGGFKAGPRGSRVLLLVDVPESGLYTLSVFGVAAGGHRWLADGCRTCLVCPSSDLTPEWRTILSGDLRRGRHLFAASLGPQTVVQRLRLEPKKSTPADYLAALDRLGLALDAAGPVTREKAEASRRFLEQRRAQQTAALCGDVVRSGSLVAELAATGPGSTGPGGAAPAGGGVPATGGGGTPTGGGPVPPPAVPPLPPGSPTLPQAFSGQ